MKVYTYNSKILCYIMAIRTYFSDLSWLMTSWSARDSYGFRFAIEFMDRDDENWLVAATKIPDTSNKVDLQEFNTWFDVKTGISGKISLKDFKISAKISWPSVRDFC